MSRWSWTKEEIRIAAAPDSEIVVILEDSLTLSERKTVLASALKADFLHVLALVYSKGTGNIA